MQLAPPHARFTARAISVAVSIAVAIAVAISISVAVSGCASGLSGRSARGPPLPLHIALERAHQVLCVDGGVESPRALVAALAPDDSCSAVGVAARVRCYLALPDSTISVRPVRGGYRFWFALPRLSDHVHEVTVRRSRGRIVVEVDSRN